MYAYIHSVTHPTVTNKFDSEAKSTNRQGKVLMQLREIGTGFNWYRIQNWTMG